MIKKIINIIICTVLLITFNHTMTFSKYDEGAGVMSDWTKKSDTTSSSSDPFSGAQNFLKQGENQVDETLNEAELEDASNTIFNVVLGIAIIIAVAIGIVIGIKFMLASSTEKAEIKELLVPYVMGVIVVFGAIGIWKLAITVFDDF